MTTIEDKLPEETLEDVDGAEMESKREKTKYGSHIADDG